MQFHAGDPCQKLIGIVTAWFLGRLERKTMASFSYDDIYRVVASIPSGRVATYGQVARLAGIPRRPRSVGYALSALDSASSIPWHRVVNAGGKISERSHNLGAEDTQRIRLEREGVRFDTHGRLNLAEVQWEAG
jgi:methylated-DNA-protein-cysteine methyltransferase-like protein